MKASISPNEVRATKRAGMQCVGLTTNTTREKLSKADLVVDAFSEIDLDLFSQTES